jgi:hypothetical protein
MWWILGIFSSLLAVGGAWMMMATRNGAAESSPQSD